MSANQIRSMIFKEISYISSLNLGHVGEKNSSSFVLLKRVFFVLSITWQVTPDCGMFIMLFPKSLTQLSVVIDVTNTNSVHSLF